MNEQLYEQSRLAGEIGAAVHLAPNSNGIIRRWGLRAENFGANSMNRIKEIHQSGRIIKDIDLTYANALWQHPWQLVHRASLHSALRILATEETDEYGPPAKLHTSSRVVNIDPAKGAITLADESVIQADVLIGADGVYVSIAVLSFDSILTDTNSLAVVMLLCPTVLSLLARERLPLGS